MQATNSFAAWSEVLNHDGVGVFVAMMVCALVASIKSAVLRMFGANGFRLPFSSWNCLPSKNR